MQRLNRIATRSSIQRLAVLLTTMLTGGVGLAQEPTQAEDHGKAKVIELKAQAVRPDRVRTLSAEAKSHAAQTVFVGIEETCHVDSRIGVSINVYINGRYRGTIPPWGDIYPFVGDRPGDVTTLYAVSTDGRYTWGPHNVRQATGDYHWVLRP